MIIFARLLKDISTRRLDQIIEGKTFFNLRRALATACCKGAGAQLYVWLAPLKTAFGFNHINDDKQHCDLLIHGACAVSGDLSELLQLLRIVSVTKPPTSSA